MNWRRVPLSAGLYLVATPIGSARDITLRALDILASADVIAAEDTRTARKLLDIHGVTLDGRPLIAFHDHSGPGVVKGLVGRIAQGASIACVSEAGTPLIADPGYELALAVREAGLPLTAAPGPSAVVTALSLSGLPSDRFAFCGFLPSAQTQRRTEIASLRDVPFTLVFYESPKRVHESLDDLCEVLGGDRQAALCRELTKKFEEVATGTLRDLTVRFADQRVKGEIVLVVGRAGAEEVATGDVEAALLAALRTDRVKDAATMVSGAFGLPRKDVYQMALRLKDEGETE
ncbi:MAG: 16S rRNA (cytidine(1402)-2'-O)-methyltransferase [Paracoccaceae bacterium]